MDNDMAVLQRYAESQSAEAFTYLVNRHAGLVYGTCLRIMKNAHDAEDVCQECFMELARKADSVRSSLAGWLHATATSRAKNVINAAVRRREREQLALSEPAGTGREQTWEEIVPYVDEALEELPDELRVPLVLYYFESKNQSQVAEELGMDQSTVCRKLETAVQELRGKLKKTGVVASLAVLTSMLATNVAVAVPPSLRVTLVKMAIAGVGKETGAAVASSSAAATTTTTTFAGSTAIKIAAVAIAGTVIVGGAVMYQHKAPQAESSPESASEIVVKSEQVAWAKTEPVAQPESSPASDRPQGQADAIAGKAVNPVKPGLIGWWKFDEGQGEVAHDSSGYGNDVTTEAKWTDGAQGKALAFGAVKGIKLPSAAFSSVNYQISISFWQYGNPDKQPKHTTVFQAFDTSMTRRLLNCHLPWPWQAGQTIVSIEMGSGNGANKPAKADEYKGRWNHWVFTKNAETGHICMYLNGTLWHSVENQFGTCDGIAQFSIGSDVNDAVNYDGIIDDFRVYDRELQDNEVEDIYHEGLSQGDPNARVRPDSQASR